MDRSHWSHHTSQKVSAEWDAHVPQCRVGYKIILVVQTGRMKQMQRRVWRSCLPERCAVMSAAENELVRWQMTL